MKQIKINKQITNRDNQSIDKYLQEIGKVNLISADDEVELAKKIRQGDKQALEKLTKSNLRFVVSVAKQYQNQGLSLGDLISEGNLGLIKAAERFDETRGFKFISYAVWWIRQAILQALAEQSRIVRLPLNKVGYVNTISRAVIELEQQLEREPTIEEIAEKLGSTINAIEITETYKMSNKYISINAPFSQKDDGCLLDILENTNQEKPDSSLMNESLRKEISFSLTTLSERESEIIIFFFGINGNPQLTLEEIAEKMNLTRERVRQIKERAIRRLRHSSRSNGLKNYLG